MTSSSQQDPYDGRDRASGPAAAPDVGPGASSAVRWLAGGCVGMVAFYLTAFAVAIAGARAGRAGHALVAVLVALVVATALRAGGRRGRAFLARMAVGAALAALAGGAVVLVLDGRSGMN